MLASEVDTALRQWEPKVHSMLRNVYIRGMTHDEAANYLRNVIVRALDSFDPTRGTAFHTFLHTAMQNEIRTLMTRAARDKPTVEVQPWHATTFDDMTDVEIASYIAQYKPSTAQMIILDLLLCGYRPSELSKIFISRKRFSVELARLKATFSDLQKGEVIH